MPTITQYTHSRLSKNAFPPFSRGKINRHSSFIIFINYHTISHFLLAVLLGLPLSKRDLHSSQHTDLRTQYNRTRTPAHSTQTRISHRRPHHTHHSHMHALTRTPCCTHHIVHASTFDGNTAGTHAHSLVYLKEKVRLIVKL